MDGVILDDEYYYLEDIKRFLKLNGIEKDYEYIKRYIGISHEEFYLDIAKLFKCSVEKAKKIRFEYNKVYPIDYKKLLKEDAIFLLDYLKRNNYIVGLTTSASHKHTDDKLKVCSISKYFDVIVTGEDVKRKKPYPDIYLEAVNKVQLNKEDCIVIEDSPLGMKAAKDAGLKVILDYDVRIKPDTNLADYIVDDLRQVISILEG